MVLEKLAFNLIFNATDWSKKILMHLIHHEASDLNINFINCMIAAYIFNFWQIEILGSIFCGKKCVL
jgi:hypothetical protein